MILRDCPTWFYASAQISCQARIRMTLFLLLALFAGACQKPEPVAEKKPAPTSFLTIFTLPHIRESGFEAVVMKGFGDKNNTAVDVVVFPDLPSLLDSLRMENGKANADLVVGLDNAFAVSDSLLNAFEVPEELSLTEIDLEFLRERDPRLIPYASANLAFIYDSRKFTSPPLSFGELQDDRFSSQMALCDPAVSGLGRNTLLWTVALFGESGCEQLWNNFRRNLWQLRPDHDACLKALRGGDCGLMIGYSSVPAWIAEFYPSESHIQAVIPQEGSFRHTEYAALCANAPNRDTALKFLQHLIAADTQQFVMFKLAMMPVNGRTSITREFSSLPWSVYTANYRLDRSEAKRNLPLWLDVWDRLFRKLFGI